MSQSLSAVHMHLVFSTKGRRPFFRDLTVRARLHAWLARASFELDCIPTLVGGVEDHVHMLARLGRSISQAQWVKELKRTSSAWVKEHIPFAADFAWQAGYGIFSVSFSKLIAVRDYIDNQEEHHRSQSFEDELRALLSKHGETWDERYLWD